MLKRHFIDYSGTNTYCGIGAGVGEAEIAVIRFFTALQCVVHIIFGAVSDIIK